jgi:hypothetical protein
MKLISGTRSSAKNPSRLFLLFWPLICHNDYHIQRQLSLVHSIVIKAIRYSFLPRYFQIKSNMPNAFHSRWKCFWQRSGHVHLTEAYFGFGGWIILIRERLGAVCEWCMEVLNVNDREPSAVDESIPLFIIPSSNVRVEKISNSITLRVSMPNPNLWWQIHLRDTSN